MSDTQDTEQNASLLATIEGRRLTACDHDGWHQWGPYLSERQWGTVREDYSPDGDAWNYLPYDHARSRAYRWGEDGIAGFCDAHQFWCLSLALWNERDPHLKERMFGLTNEQGNHGEDVKELYFFLDGTPTHSYMRMLYKYPQAAFPYEDLLRENAARKGHDQPEYELVDTGIFKDSRYFDVGVEYAKAGPRDILMCVTVVNRGPEAAPLHVLPHLWSRNTWSWSEDRQRPVVRLERDGAVLATRPVGAPLRFSALQEADWLFCDNDTNTEALYGRAGPAYPKDAINDRVVAGREGAVNSERTGTKCAAWRRLTVPAGGTVTLRFRLAPADAPAMDRPGFDATLAARLAEADAFYAVLQSDIASEDARRVQRQALAGMLWSKQVYTYDVRRWLTGDPTQVPPPSERRRGRNSDWLHLNNADIISMPDTWEYPWYASWDLAFHCVTFALIDPAFAKGQLILLTREWYMHPNGQLPAYEWNFSDVNPPVHAWAALRVYQMDKALTGTADTAFLERVFHKLMLNFTWWVNQKDAGGRNIFEGGFLGLDNIGVFDRSKPLPTGGHIAQADGTGWMAMYTLNLARIALELSLTNSVYEDVATKFFEHFLVIAAAMNGVGELPNEQPMGLWDETDGFYYDMLDLPDGRRVPLRVRSLVGLIPLLAVEALGGQALDKFPDFQSRMRWILTHRPDLAALVSRWAEPGKDRRVLLSLLRRQRMTALLSRMLDESEFLSPYGVRSVSKVHAEHPYVYEADGNAYSVDYEPGESTTTLFGGNSNWRGPIWMPINYLLIEALYEFEKFYDPDFMLECPTGSGQQRNIAGVAEELTRRLCAIFLRDENGRRAVFGDEPLFQDDPAFRDHVPFNEYFHGDTGKGLGASHQTGWTGLVALLLQPRRRTEAGLQPVSADTFTRAAPGAG